MTPIEGLPSLHLPARDIPIPSSVSAEARAILAAPRQAAAAYPPPDDVPAWKAMIAAQDAAVAAMVDSRPVDAAVTVEDAEFDGVPVYVVTPPGATEGRVYLELHGGALILGGGLICRGMAARTAARIGAQVWSVDYRMPPDHPYPTPLKDCVAVYRALLKDHRPEQIVIGGGSAGGNLAAALLLRARDEGLPLPAALVLNTPEVDLTESGDSFQTNLGLDPVLQRSLMPVNLLYAAGHDLTDPYLSPLFGDFTKGFPPTMLTTGTRDLFLSNTVRLHRALRAAGIRADLHVMEAAGHGGFLGMAPEDTELDREIRRFVDAHWAD
ncbi:alpha/beta hydrolase fold domain-containing protein [Frankia sp. AgB1.9]|uniref:alpha/beta hydrolase fold domain-containing protein n=1 Tax=unclassified Frankia TaxID=2632575 RepID=UPI001932AD1D|nr:MULTISPECIES: alpha/beta hydrolase fold domain-containing protein [unclassified Frankia]MBL7487553.1 alpha/beta hydrolase fold domain-containing protein [Frankia sp. AgW1.1]MBL7549524.1 alpha/beta hydrolase fold domain-containing protein [Frankia sp. AgB1.9]MBL7620687.1 alpha/beta hydrolase fold domain-containing protein [Frankia sp. AgB1.8]